jgi:hypothetical protein
MKNIMIVIIALSLGSCFGPCNKSTTGPIETQAVTALPDLQSDEALQRECAILFKSILAIQDNRELQRVQFEQIHRAFNEEKIPQEKFSVARMIWLDRENALATEAANKYTLGRMKGCFQKVSQ